MPKWKCHRQWLTAAHRGRKSALGELDDKTFNFQYFCIFAVLSSMSIWREVNEVHKHVEAMSAALWAGDGGRYPAGHGVRMCWGRASCFAEKFIGDDLRLLCHEARSR